MAVRVEVFEVGCLKDNYAYVVRAAGHDRALVVDPSDLGPVQLRLSSLGLALGAILATHHHADHVGGIEALCARHPGVPVYAHRSDLGRVPGQTHAVDDGAAFSVAGLEVTPHHVPGHTLGAVAYHVGDALFTGDTLFVGGCGRLFEGTPELLYHSLCDVLARLPPATRIYCGHEYTVKNLLFAASVEPDSAPVAARLAWAEARARAGVPTVPSTIADELATNPFLRCGEPALAARMGTGSPVATLAALRRAKDAF
ncbi:MAG: hydroxyacylglutathione hydrolase [Polyangiaceae bacterium]|nr:hydroxyacylglutathione hydrolase [Polyangiaceae bacterium]